MMSYQMIKLSFKFKQFITFIGIGIFAMLNISKSMNLDKNNYDHYFDKLNLHLKDSSKLYKNYTKKYNLNLIDYIKIVKSNHPIAKNTKLINTLAENNLLKANGSFDPKLFSNYESKAFDKKNYFNITNSGISVPTYPGIDIKAGVETSNGLFAGDQNTLPPNGLAFLGVTLPVGQGLFIDKRRADVNKAELLLEAAEFERQVALNDLYNEALYAYFDWIKTWKTTKVLEQAKENALVRHKGIVQNFFAGDEPAIDTVETFIQFQTLELNFINSVNSYYNSILNLNNFLWFDDQPIFINPDIIPDTTIHQNQVLDSNFINNFYDIVDFDKDSLIRNHPEVKNTEYKIKTLNVELELFNDRLKPTLNLTYNIINEYLDWDGLREDVGYLRNNYKGGIEFNFPIFLRKERGDIEATETKIKDNEFNLQNKIINLKNKIEQEFNNLQMLRQNYQYSFQIRDNYKKLLSAEEVKFDLGESSIFLINSREIKFLESEIKLIESDVKAALQYFKYLYVNGILYRL